MAMSAGGDPSRPEMNVTPLIDVLLVLIIIFMVIVVEQGNKGITAQIPQPAKDATEPDRERTIVVQLVSVPGQDQPPALKINQQTVGWGNLGSELQRVFATRAEKVSDNVYKIFGAGGNTTVFVRSDGVTLVDTKLANNGAAILNVVRSITDKPFVAKRIDETSLPVGSPWHFMVLHSVISCTRSFRDGARNE